MQCSHKTSLSKDCSSPLSTIYLHLLEVQLNAASSATFTGGAAEKLDGECGKSLIEVEGLGYLEPPEITPALHWEDW